MLTYTQAPSHLLTCLHTSTAAQQHSSTPAQQHTSTAAQQHSSTATYGQAYLRPLVYLLCHDSGNSVNTLIDQLLEVLHSLLLRHVKAKLLLDL